MRARTHTHTWASQQCRGDRTQGFCDNPASLQGQASRRSSAKGRALDLRVHANFRKHRRSQHTSTSAHAHNHVCGMWRCQERRNDVRASLIHATCLRGQPIGVRADGSLCGSTTSARMRTCALKTRTDAVQMLPDRMGEVVTTTVTSADRSHDECSPVATGSHRKASFGQSSGKRDEWSISANSAMLYMWPCGSNAEYTSRRRLGACKVHSIRVEYMRCRISLPQRCVCAVQLHENLDTITSPLDGAGSCANVDGAFPLLVSTELAPASVSAFAKQRSASSTLPAFSIKKTATCIFGETALSASTAVARTSSAAAAVEHAAVSRT